MGREIIRLVGAEFLTADKNTEFTLFPVFKSGFVITSTSTVLPEASEAGELLSSPADLQEKRGQEKTATSKTVAANLPEYFPNIKYSLLSCNRNKKTIHQKRF